MKKQIAILVAAAVGVCSAAPVWADGTSSPNKVVVAASQSGLDLTTNPTLTVQITKAKVRRKHKMVIAHAVINTNTVATIIMRVEINGIRMEPDQIAQKCAGSCVLASTWWLDLDQAELANPGVFLNTLPLNVQVIGGASGPANSTMSITASIVPKN